MLETSILISLLMSGLAAGFVAGLLGIGGGFVVVPVLIWLLPNILTESAYAPHYAVGTSLTCIVITAIVSTRSHHRRGGIDWPAFRYLAPGVLLGSLSGAAIAGWLSSQWLSLFFVTGAYATALYLSFGRQPEAHQQQPVSVRYSLIAYPFGIISALIGIGGGSLVAPFLKSQGRPMVKAVGTAAACGLPIAVAGSLGFALEKAPAQPLATGFVYWPAVVAIILGSVFTAPLGAKVAHGIDEKILKRIFALFLIFSGSQILYSQVL